MSQEALSLSPEGEFETKKDSGQSQFLRVARYTLVRILTLLVTVSVGMYLTVLVANMGGHVDNIRKAAIREGVANLLIFDEELRKLPAEERTARMESMIAQEEKRVGLDKPFIVRSFGYVTDALTLNLGFAEYMSSDSGSRQVRLIILERLPPTLVLFATSNLFLFFFSIFLALSLSRNYGSFLDRLIVTFAPTSAAPGWFYGIFLILIFAALLHVLPYGGMVAAPPPENPFEYALSLFKHMTLPLLAITLSSIFSQAYSWRTFFLIYSSEDYVELAKAKGLTSQDVERRYILRPTLPAIITSFAFTLITLWTGATIFETVFNWPGLGRALFQAVGLYDTPVIMGSTVIFAYLLALTVFLLDFIYALVDPRVKVGGGASA